MYLVSTKRSRLGGLSSYSAPAPVCVDGKVVAYTSYQNDPGIACTMALNTVDVNGYKVTLNNGCGRATPGNMQPCTIETQQQESCYQQEVAKGQYQQVCSTAQRPVVKLLPVSETNAAASGPGWLTQQAISGIPNWGLLLAGITTAAVLR
jgi:hypothetical protein